jgi:hypothetical protein
VPLPTSFGGNRVVAPGIEIQLASIDPVQIDERAHHAREVSELGGPPRMVRRAEERQPALLHVRQAVGDPVASDDEEVRVDDEQESGRRALDDLVQAGGMMPSFREIERAIHRCTPEQDRPFRELRRDARRLLRVVGDDDPLHGGIGIERLRQPLVERDVRSAHVGHAADGEDRTGHTSDRR